MFSEVAIFVNADEFQIQTSHVCWCMLFIQTQQLHTPFYFQGLLLVKNRSQISPSSFMNTLCQAQKVNLSTSPSVMISSQLSDNVTPTDGLNMQVLLHSNHNLEVPA